MKIIIKDKISGKQFLIVGHKLDFEIFKKSKGKIVDGVKKGEGEWVSSRTYPTTLPAAVCKCIHWCLADPDDYDQPWVAEAKTAYKTLDKVLYKRVREIVAEVQKEM